MCEPQVEMQVAYSVEWIEIKDYGQQTRDTRQREFWIVLGGFGDIMVLWIWR